MNNRLSQDKAYDYLLSGKAVVTFHNTQPKKKSEDQFTYTVRKKWVYYNNEWIGAIRNDNTFFGTFSNPVRQPVTVFAWMWNAILKQKVPDTIHIYHSGSCGRCHRQLTDKLSLITGIGPECRKILGIPNPQITADDSTDNS